MQHFKTGNLNKLGRALAGFYKLTDTSLHYLLYVVRRDRNVTVDSFKARLYTRNMVQHLTLFNPFTALTFVEINTTHIRLAPLLRSVALIRIYRIQDLHVENVCPDCSINLL